MANSETRNCQNCKNQFVIEPDDFSFYERIKVPAPILCPACRFRRRAAFRNERTLYKRVCALCGKSIITMYHSDAPHPVYCNDCWTSDKWDPRTYAMDYDTSRPFFDQLQELIMKVPQSATYASSGLGPNINSEYTNFAGGNKDCYLVFNAGPDNQNCAYSRGISGRDIFDTYFSDNGERLYEGVNVQRSTGIAWGQNVSDCVDSWFVLNCIGCQNCFGCVNLRHKSYYFFNEPLDKDEWRRRVSEVAGSYKKIEEAKKQFEKFSLKFPRREHSNFKSVGGVGDYIVESKNCFDCFEVSFSEDVRHSFSLKSAKDCSDLLGHGRKSELLLEGVGVGIGQRVIGSWWVETAHDVEYSFATRSSEYCIGCVSIKNGKYMILNKQYNESDYHRLREHIVAELTAKNLYGIFVPQQLSFFGYNETVGQDNLPLTKEEALAQGFKWQDDIQATSGKETLKPDDIPDHIKDVDDGIVNEVLVCITCNRNYRIIKMELDMYQKAMVPIPRECFNCRYLARLRRRGPFVLYDRTCAKCGKGIKTNFAPDRPEIVYCEACYNAEVI